MRRLLPGDRRVWLVAVVACVAFGGAIAYEVLRPRDFFTGTNNVRSRSVVADLRGGDRLCVPDLDIPTGTGRVEFDLTGPQQRPALNLELRIEGRTFRGSRPIESAPTARKTPIAIPVVSLRRPSAPGNLCLTLEGPGRAVFGGMSQLQRAERGPTVDGRPLGARISIWFRPPAGEQRSIAGQWPDISRRASLFRPGFFGPWVYWFVLLGLAPALAYLATRALARASAGELTSREVLSRIAALAFVSSLCWSVITPAFDAPDETDHFGYAQYLAETGNAPCQSCLRQPSSTEQRVAVGALRVYSHIEAHDGRPPWLKVDEQRWKRAVRAVGELKRDDGGGPTTAATHTPAYYSLLTPAYGAASSQSIFSRLHLMRLISALLGAIAAACAFLTVREILPARQFAAAAAGLVAGFQPMFGFISGAVNNDAGVNAAAAVAIYLIVRALRRGLTSKLALGLAAVLVLVPLMKVTGYAVYPAALTAAAVLAWRERHRFSPRPWLVLLMSFAVLQIAWKVISPEFDRTAFATPGGGVPGTQGPVADALADLPAFASYLWQVFLPKLPFMADMHPQNWPAYDIYVERGFAAFGWYAYTFPAWVYRVIVLVMLATAAAATATLWKHRESIRRIRTEVLVMFLVIAAVIGGVEASYFDKSGTRHAVAEQGRYAFTALVPLTVVVVGACFAFGRRTAPWLAFGLTVAMIGLNYASQWMFVSTAYS